VQRKGHLAAEQNDHFLNELIYIDQFALRALLEQHADSADDSRRASYVCHCSRCGFVSLSDRSTLLRVSAALHRSAKGLLFLFRRSVSLPAHLRFARPGKRAHYLPQEDETVFGPKSGAKVDPA
jgi:hypothetical protein